MVWGCAQFLIVFASRINNENCNEIKYDYLKLKRNKKIALSLY